MTRKNRSSYSLLPFLLLSLVAPILGGEKNLEKALTVREFFGSGSLKEECPVIERDGYMIKHGLCTSWDTSGVKSSTTTYKNGKRHGPRISWWVNGQKRTSTIFRDGVLHGRAEWFDSKGRLQGSNTYSNGVIIDSGKFPPKPK